MVKELNGDCTIYCFEPILETYGLLSKNINVLKESFADSDFRAHCINKGVSDFEGSSIFNYYPGSPQSSTYSEVGVNAYSEGLEILKKELMENPDKIDDYYPKGRTKSLSEGLKKDLIPLLCKSLSTKREEICKITTLENIFYDYKIENVNLLKIDVEGAELDVINGLPKNMWQKVDQVLVEIHDYDEALKKITQIFESMDYNVAYYQDGKFTDRQIKIYNLLATRV
ncbi:MAG: FkbM family methyltransferase [Flavobacterium sp.]|nr:MAG: FkbM family methyltransferase [Flavobacterium sp.]